MIDGEMKDCVGGFENYTLYKTNIFTQKTSIVEEKDGNIPETCTGENDIPKKTNQNNIQNKYQNKNNKQVVPSTQCTRYYALEGNRKYGGIYLKLDFPQGCNNQINVPRIGLLSHANIYNFPEKYNKVKVSIHNWVDDFGAVGFGGVGALYYSEGDITNKNLGGNNENIHIKGGKEIVYITSNEGFGEGKESKTGKYHITFTVNLLNRKFEENNQHGMFSINFGNIATKQEYDSIITNFPKILQKDFKIKHSQWEKEVENIQERYTKDDRNKQFIVKHYSKIGLEWSYNNYISPKADSPATFKKWYDGVTVEVGNIEKVGENKYKYTVILTEEKKETIYETTIELTNTNSVTKILDYKSNKIKETPTSL